MATNAALRDPLELVVTLKYASVAEFDSGFAPCVCAEVVFFKTKQTRPIGTFIRLVLRLKDGSPALSLEGQVLWAFGPEHVPRGRSAGMGIQAAPVDDFSARRLQTILKA